MVIELPADLLNHLQGEHQRAFDTSLMEERKIAVEFYQGKPFGDEVEGRSQLVTRDVAEVIDYVAINVLQKVISDKVVEFEARREADVERAAEATELVAWQFMREQAGISIVRSALLSGLKEKTGVLKTWVEQAEETVEGFATNLDDESIIAAEETGEYDADPVTGEVVPLHRVLRRVKAPARFRDSAVPNEEFGFSPDARSLDEAGYIVHRTRYSLFQLAETFGIPHEEAALYGDDTGVGRQLSDARDSGRSYKDGDDSGSGLARKVWVEEEYVRWDWNGDGHAELIRVQRVGTRGISVEQVDEQPFVIWSPFPAEHRIVGESLADKTMDIQRIRSMLLRQAMDALYFANAPRSLIETSNMDPNTIDDMLSIVPGAPIRYTGTAPQPWQMPFAAPHAFTALEFMTGERESRTGVTRHNQGLNPDSLNKTASGMAMLRESGDQIPEYIAYNFAECLAELFEKKLRLMNKHGKTAELRVGGEFKQVDAGTLSSDMDLGIRVGLGTGRKDQRLQHRMMLLDLQKQAREIGSPLVDDKKLYNSAEGIVADAGLGDVNNFFNDPDTVQQDPNAELQKDPATIEAEGKVAVEIEKERTRQAEIAARAEKDAAILNNELQIKAMGQQREYALGRERMYLELGMAYDREGLAPDFRPGGRLDA
ncbi:MAG: hypothetical protein J7500_15740 [Sphingomonas sp.]|uniref:portal protein n=1 Tax=Sphingomonas sp. TaxID=28214 RepID=UPI001B19D4F4|nr:hypothetical protein [Sphingomonas sp.]MBO9624160.1 hypothetical protein [Sphingomonas sp.]